MFHISEKLFLFSNRNILSRTVESKLIFARFVMMQLQVGSADIFPNTASFSKRQNNLGQNY